MYIIVACNDLTRNEFNDSEKIDIKLFYFRVFKAYESYNNEQQV